MATIIRGKESVARSRSLLSLVVLFALYGLILWTQGPHDSTDVANSSTIHFLSSSIGGATPTVTTSTSPASADTAITITTTTTTESRLRPPPSLSRQVLQSVKYKPLQCLSFLSNNTLNNNKDPNGLERVHRQTTTKPPFWISVHKKEFDYIRWDIIEYGRYYELELESIWAHILQKSITTTTSSTGSTDTTMTRVLDVGGNVGYFSLYSASFGPTVVVDAFEPNYVNNLRFCESVLLNDWSNEYNYDDSSSTTSAQHNDNSNVQNKFPRAAESNGAMVNIFQYGVSSHPGVLTFQENINPGGGSFSKNSDRHGALPVTQQIEVLTLDDFGRERGWFEPTTQRPNIAIMKIDVEGHTAEVLLGAKELIQQRLVQNIFTEIHHDDDEQNQRASFDLLLKNGYQLVGQGSFRGPGRKSLWKSDDTLLDNILTVINHGKGTPQFMGYLNLWWSLDGATRPENVTFF